MSIIKHHKFGVTPKGIVNRYLLENQLGTSIGILNYGGIIQSLVLKDQDGNDLDIVFGYDTIAEYQKDTIYTGGIIGQYANRIRHGRFKLDGDTHQLTCNHNGHHLHGGQYGFLRQIWSVDPITEASSLRLRLTSEEDEEGYPGKVDVTVEYTLDNQNRLIIDYAATTDSPTPISLTNHSYFNLNGVGNGTIYNHQLKINANEILEVDQDLIPTGQFISVTDTPFDLRQPVMLEKYLSSPHPSLQPTSGYDHQFVLDKEKANISAEVFCVESGLSMKMITTAPGVQLYTANGIGKIIGKHNKPYHNHHAFCLEAQSHPDSPNHPHFPNTILRPGELYQMQTIYHFSVKS